MKENEPELKKAPVIMQDDNNTILIVKWKVGHQAQKL